MSMKLTAEQVRDAIFIGSVYASYDGAKYYANGINMQAIADELNAALGCVECEVKSSYFYDEYGVYEYNFTCGHGMTLYDEEPPNFCPECGTKIRKAVEQ